MNEPITPVKWWLNEIAASRKREKDFRKDGAEILKIYSGEKTDTIPFNILYSNTETLSPALYSAIPRPVVSRRFKDTDPLGASAAQAGERGLSFLIDTNVDGYETFDEGVRAAVLDALLPGRGVTAVKYDAQIEEMPPEEGEEEPTPYKDAEMVCLDSRSWNRVYFGYAKKWSKVPWVAFEIHIDKIEAERLFGDEIANKLNYTRDEDEATAENKDENERNKGERKTVCIYQIWDKDGKGTPETQKKVRYICDQYPEFLKVSDDPLGLTGFFNIPKPIQFMEKSNDLTPTALYKLYENQAKELNSITTRINRLVKAIKARGVYDAALGTDIANVMSADDNMLMPSSDTAGLAAEKGLQNAIWFMPIDVMVNTLMQLYAAREQCKQVIYEVTGISDIIRGSTVASETATAQNLKSQWGTLRLKRLQKEVQRYCRDLLRMMLEIAASKFSEETWAKMTGLPFVTSEQRQQDEQMFQLIQQQMQMMPPPQEGEPPNPMMQEGQRLQAELQKPVWSDVLALLKDDVQRSYRIDIETNSTLEPEAAEDQKSIADMLAGMGQVMNGLGPLVKEGVMPFDAVKVLLQTVARRSRFGPEIENQINQMQPPQPQPDPKQQMEQQKMQGELEMQKMEIQSKQGETQSAMQLEQMKLQMEQQRLQMEQQKMQMEMEQAQAEHQMKMQEMAAKVQMNEIISASKIKVALMTAEMKEKQAKEPHANV